MRRVLAVGIVAAAAMAVAGCGQARSESGPTVSRNYSVGGFTGVDIAGPYDVEVHTGANPSVSASGPQKLIEGMVVEVNGDRLSIHPREEHGSFTLSWGSNRTVRVVVTVPQIKGATIGGSGDLHISQVKGDSFDGSVGGSGDLSIDQVDVQRLKLAIGGSGDIKTGSGRAQAAEYQVGGSGDIDARKVEAQTASVSVAGSGDVSARATGTADISIVGAGDVEVTGGAKCTISKQGSGDVRCG